MSKRIYTRLGKFVFPYWPLLLISTIASLIYVVFNSLSVWLTASLINNILSDYENLVVEQTQLALKTEFSLNDRLKFMTNKFIIRDTSLETLQVLCLTIVAIFIVKNLFLYLKNVSMAFVQLQIVTRLRNQLYKHLQSLSLSFFHNKKSGDLTSVIIHDVGIMNSAIGTTFHKIIVEPINILAFGILLFIISWELSLIALLIIPFSQLAVSTIGKSIRRKARRNTRQIGDILSIIADTLSSIQIVKAFTMEDHEIKRFKKESWTYFNLLYRSAKLKHISSPVIETIGICMAVLLLWLGGKEVIQGNGITSEDFLRFIFLLFAIMGPIRSLSNVNINLQNGYASAERFFEIIDIEPEIKDKPNAVEISGLNDKIKFENVGFTYDKENNFSLESITFNVKKGQIVALVGSSGSGKTTIADLIPRFYDIQSGSIYIDDEDIRDIESISLRQTMGIVTQETILLNDTIRYNITYGCSSVEDDDLLAAAKVANALEFINNLPEGFDTIIGEKGVKLSGGQRQRIAIARAVLKNPPILILDEATSALDSESERLVQEAIESLIVDRTVIVIAHRLSTVKNADKIIVLDKGKIAEQGTHKELIQLGKHYKFLYDNQLRG